MISTSKAYKEAILKNRVMYHKARIVLASGEEIVVMDRQLMSFVYEDAVSSDNAFDIGAAIINSFSCTIDNANGQYTFKDFTGAVVHPSIGLLLPNGTAEWIQRGIYYVTNSPKADVTISLSCLDRMSFFEKRFDSVNIAYPTTIQTLVERCCQNCNVPFYDVVPNGSFPVPALSGDGITYLTIISECAKAAGCWARIDQTGNLRFNWYQLLAQSADGGYFDSAVPLYQSGCSMDGGYFDDGTPSYLSGDTFNSSDFSTAEYHHIYTLMNNTIETKQIVITGVSVKSGETEYLSGLEGYVLSVESMIATEKTAGRLADYLSGKIAGMSLYKANVTALSDPSVEAGDCVVYTDRKAVSFGSYLTRVRYSARSSEEYITAAESISENTSDVYTPETRVLLKAQAGTKQQIKTYDQTVQDMTSLIAQGFGLYFTKLEDQAGGTKLYMHDKQTIEESTMIWTITAQGLMVSTNGTATWAVDKNGNALFNVITARGINADWINIGGQGNGDGRLVVKSSSGTPLIILDNQGITMADGTSLINASGVCGDLTFTSGGTPYDLGWAGNVAIGNFRKQEVYLQAVIPDNYVITSAVLVLSTCATVWNNIWDADASGNPVYNTATGYPRGIKAYIGTGQVYKEAAWDGEYSFSSTGTYTQVLSGGFTSGGTDGSASTTPKQIKSGNIKTMLQTGLNTVRITVADYTGTTNLTYAQRTGTATSLLSIKGYTKNQ